MFADRVVDQRLTLADPPVRRPKAREAANEGYGWIGVFGLVLFAIALVEAVLGFRVWVQLSGDPLHNQASDFIYRLGGWLTSPFDRYETFQSGRSIGILQFASLIAAEVYLVGGLIALIAVYMLRSLMTPLWDLAWRPIGFVLGGLKTGTAWLAGSAGFGLLRLVDQATLVWLAAIQPALKRGFVQTAAYSKREGPVVLRELRARSEQGLERSATYSKQGSAFVLQKSSAGYHRVLVPMTKSTRRQIPIVSRKFASTSGRVIDGLIRLAEKEIRLLKVELRGLARDYAISRGRHYHGQARNSRG